MEAKKASVIIPIEVCSCLPACHLSGGQLTVDRTTSSQSLLKKFLSMRLYTRLSNFGNFKIV